MDAPPNRAGAIVIGVIFAMVAAACGLWYAAESGISHGWDEFVMRARFHHLRASAATGLAGAVAFGLASIVVLARRRVVPILVFSCVVIAFLAYVENTG